MGKDDCVMLIFQVRKSCLFAYVSVKKEVKLATIVKGDLKAPFSIATTTRCKGGHYYFLWIASLYPWSVFYNGEC